MAGKDIFDSAKRIKDETKDKLGIDLNKGGNGSSTTKTTGDFNADYKARVAAQNEKSYFKVNEQGQVAPKTVNERVGEMAQNAAKSLGVENNTAISEKPREAAYKIPERTTTQILEDINGMEAMYEGWKSGKDLSIDFNNKKERDKFFEDYQKLYDEYDYAVEYESALGGGEDFDTFFKNTEDNLNKSHSVLSELRQKKTAAGRGRGLTDISVSDFEFEKAEFDYKRAQKQYDKVHNEKIKRDVEAEGTRLEEEYKNDVKNAEKYVEDGKKHRDNMLSYMEREGEYNERYKVMTDLEKNTYNYILGKYGFDKAQEYINSREHIWNKKVNQPKVEEHYKWADENPGKAAAASFMMPLAGAQAIGGGLEDAFFSMIGKPQVYDAYADDQMWLRQKNAYREGSTEDLGAVGKWFAQAGYSMGDVVTAMPLGPNLSLAVLGTNAAGDKFQNIMDNGGTLKQALTSGAISGAIEIFTEKMGIDNLFDLIGKPSANIAKSIAKQIGAEAMEEGISAYANFLSDETILKENSEFNKYIKKLTAEGMSKRDASKVAAVEFLVKQPFLDMLAGGFSGGVLGGVGAVGGRIGAGIQMGDNYAYEIEKGRSAKEGTNYQQYAEKLEQALNGDGKAPGIWQKGKLAAEREAYFGDSENVGYEINNNGKTTEVISAGLSAPKGSNTRAMAEEIKQKAQRGERITDNEIGELYKSVTTEKFEENKGTELSFLSADNYTARLINMGESGVDAKEIGAIITDVFEGKNVSDAAVEVVAKNDNARKVLSQETGIEINDSFTETQKTEAARQIILAVKGEINVKGNDADTNAVRESAAVRVLENAKKDFGESGVIAFEKILSESRENNADINIDTLYRGYERYYEAGRVGIDYRSIPKTTMGNAISEDIKLRAFASGVADAEAETKKWQGSKSDTIHFGKAARLVVNDYSRTLSYQQQSDLNGLAKALGVRIEIVDSIKDGQANGEYKDGVIKIAKDCDNAFLTTAVHEAVHRLKEMDIDAYRRLAKYVSKNFLMKGDSRRASLAKATQTAYGKAGVEITLSEATEENVADFLANLVENRAEIRKLVGADLNLAQKVYKAIKEVFEKVKAFFSGRSVDNKEIKARFKALEMFEQEIVRARNNARENVADNNKDTSDNEVPVKYSITEIKSATQNYGEGVLLDTDIFDGVHPRNWDKILRDFVQNNLAGKVITVFNEDGTQEKIYFAKSNERVTKDGANNSHKVIDKLARQKGIVNALMTVQIDEVFDVAKITNQNKENSHQWLDENGWIIKTIYVQTIKGGIYESTLNIARTRDGRDLMYAFSNTKRVDGGDVPSTEKGRGSHTAINSYDSISQPDSGVKKYSLKEAGKTSSISFKSDIEDYPYNMQTVIKDYLEYSNEGIRNFVERVRKGEASAKERLYIDLPTQRAIKDIKLITGIDTSEFKTAIETRAIEHIEKFHGVKGKANTSMARIEDIERIQFVLNNYDEMEYGGKSEAYTTIKENGKPGQADTVIYSKKINGTFYVVEAVPDTKAKTLFVVSAYINKEGSTQLPNANSPVVTPEAPSADIPSDKRLSQTEENVKKYSLKGVDTLGEFNKLTEQDRALKAKLDVKDRLIMDRRATMGQARRMVKEFGSRAKAGDIEERIYALYNKMHRGGDSRGPLAFNDFQKEARSIASDILKNVSVVDAYAKERYDDFLSNLKGRTIYISEADAADISDYNDFRKRYVFRLNLKKVDGYRGSGDYVDTIYQEMAAAYPDLISGEAQAAGDMLYEIGEVIDSLSEYTKNPFEGDNLTESMLTNEIIETFFDTPQTEATEEQKTINRLVAERVTIREQERARYEKRLQSIEKVRAEHRAEVKEAVKREREKKEKAISEIQQKNRETLKRVREQKDDIKKKAIEDLKKKQEAAKVRQKERMEKGNLINGIRREHKHLSSMLINPTEKRYVPESLKGPIAEFLKMIEITSSKTPEQITKTAIKVADLYKKLEAIEKQKGECGALDPDLEAHFEELEGFVEEGRFIDTYSNRELMTIYKSIAAVRSFIINLDRTFGEYKAAHISELGEMVIKDNRVSGGYVKGIGAKESIKGLLNFDMIDSFRFFEVLGDTAEDVFTGLRGGFNRYVENVNEIREYAAEILKDFDIKKVTGSGARAYRTILESGESIDMTKAEIMSLYMLSKRRQAHDHLYKGGIKLEAKKKRLEGEGKYRASHGAVRITPADLGKIIENLTNEEKKVAENIGLFFTETAKWGNEVSMKLYGYEKFNDASYFPIKVDDSFLKKDFDSKREAHIKNSGFTKSVVKGANNPIVVEDIFDVFTSHTEKMALYNAFVLPLNDMQKVWNHQSENSSVKDSIERKFGRRALDYFDNLMKDLNGGTKGSRGNEVLSMMMGKAKATAVGFNLSVIIQQPTAIIRAFSEINPLYFVKSAAYKNSWEHIKKTAPIAQWKEWGYFQFDTGKSTKDIILNKKSVSDISMWGAGKGDEFGWKRIFNACEAETRSLYPELEKGSDEYWAKVSERFTEIIDKTQVVDSVFHRSQMMRSPDGLQKAATAFMGEPTKCYNMLWSAIRGLKNGSTSKGKMGKVLAAYGVSVVLNNALKSLVYALRDDEDEKYWTKWLEQFLNSLMTEPLNMVPIVKDIVSLFQGYDMKRIEFNGISSVISAGQNLFKEKETPQYKIINMVAAIGDLMGWSTSNAKREIMTALKSVAEFSGNNYFEYLYTKQLYRIDNSENKSKFIDILYRSRENEAEFEKIKADLLKNDMFDEKYIKNQINSRLKKDAKESEIVLSELDKIKLSLEEDTRFKNMTPLMQEEGLKKAEQYTIGEEVRDDDIYSGDLTLVEKINGGIELGISPAQYILYDLACEMAKGDKQTLGVDEKFDVVEGLEMTDEQKAYLYMSKGSDSSEENRQKYEDVLAGGEAIGLTGWEYIMFKELCRDADEAGDNNGSPTQKEVIAELSGADWLSREEKNYLIKVRWPKTKKTFF